MQWNGYTKLRRFLINMCDDIIQGCDFRVTGHLSGDTWSMVEFRLYINPLLWNIVSISTKIHAIMLLLLMCLSNFSSPIFKINQIAKR